MTFKIQAIASLRKLIGCVYGNMMITKLVDEK